MTTINKLTWKYFLEQKNDELKILVYFLYLGFVFPLVIGFFLGIKGNDIGGTLIGMWIIGLIISIVLFLLCFWIRYNWKKAKRRASREVNKSKKKKGVKI